MKIFCAIAICSVAWADVGNLDTLITNCSDESRAQRLRAVKTNLGKTLLEGYKMLTDDMCPKANGIVLNVMEVQAYAPYARKLMQMDNLSVVLTELAKAERPATDQIIVKQCINYITSAIYILPEIILAIEMLEKEVLNGELDRKFRAGQIKKHGLVLTANEYEELLQNIKKLEINKMMLF